MRRLPSFLHDLLGESPKPWEMVAVLVFGICCATLLVWTEPKALPMWRSASAWLLIADIAAGSLANFTRSTNDYYATRAAHRWAFIAFHVHLLALAWVLHAGWATALGVWAYTIVGASLVNVLAGRSEQTFVGGLLLAIGLVGILFAPDMSTAFRTASALFLLKVLFSFAVDHHRQNRIQPKESSVAVHRGDLYWVAPNDARGSVERIAHPHVVIQEDVFNQSRIHSVLMCALTSNLQRANEPGNVLLEEGEGNLPKRSVLVVSQVDAVDKAQLGAYIGTLSEQRVQQVLDGMRFQQASFFNRR